MGFIIRKPGKNRNNLVFNIISMALWLGMIKVKINKYIGDSIFFFLDYEKFQKLKKITIFVQYFPELFASEH